jgi:hypothetical protein
MIHNRKVVSDTYLVLWQAGIVGDKTAVKLSNDKVYRRVLIAILNKYCPNEYKVVLYECSTVTIKQPRIEWIN